MFLNHLSEVSDADGVEKAYEEAMEKVREYPSCYPLILNIALFLDGIDGCQGKGSGTIPGGV